MKSWRAFADLQNHLPLQNHLLLLDDDPPWRCGAMLMASKASIFRWFLPYLYSSDPHPTASSPSPYTMTDPDHAPSDTNPKAEDPLLQGLRCLDLKREDEEDEGESDKVEVERGKGVSDEKDKAKDEEEEGEGIVEVESGDEVRSVRYPVRPGAEDCSYYMRTGNCKFGSACKFNHPVVRKNQDKVKEKEESKDRASRTECKGEKECPYYMCTGSCKYAANCRFNHPDPSAGAGDLSPEYINGMPAPLSSGSQLSVTSWSTPGSMNESPPYLPIMYSPTHGVSSHGTEWNRYQYQINTQGPNMHSAAAYVQRSPMTDGNIYAQHQQHVSGDEFPERPGQPECSYFMKTGDCKFKSNFKYHHPKDQVLKSPSVTLSDKGLPLRPDQNICSYYSRYGICKFGPACKFDHSMNLGSSQLASWSESVDGDVWRNAEEGEGGIQQSV